MPREGGRSSSSVGEMLFLLLVMFAAADRTRRSNGDEELSLTFVVPSSFWAGAVIHCWALPVRVRGLASSELGLCHRLPRLYRCLLLDETAAPLCSLVLAHSPAVRASFAGSRSGTSGDLSERGPGRSDAAVDSPSAERPAVDGRSALCAVVGRAPSSST